MARESISTQLVRVVTNVYSTTSTGAFSYTINNIPTNKYLILFRVKLQTTGHVKLSINGGTFIDTDYNSTGFAYGWDAANINSGSAVIASDSTTTARIEQIFMYLIPIHS